MTLHYFPLPHIEERYSGMMNDVLAPLVTVSYSCGHFEKSAAVTTGEFLDSHGIQRWYAQQVLAAAAAFEAGAFHDGDAVLFADAYSPLPVAVRQMAELAGIHLTLGAWNWAGRADPDDFIQRCGPWATTWERAVHEALDVVYVGSVHHADNVVNTFGHACAVQALGAPFSASWVEDRVTDDFDGAFPDRKVVVWPHRPAWEKGVAVFRDVVNEARQRGEDWLFVACSSGRDRRDDFEAVGLGMFDQRFDYYSGLSKGQYYSLLRRADACLCTGTQETYGYAVREALVLGTPVVAPAVSAYHEVPVRHYGHPLRFKDATDALAAELQQPPDRELPRAFRTRWEGAAALAVADLRNRASR